MKWRCLCVCALAVIVVGLGGCATQKKDVQLVVGAATDPYEAPEAIVAQTEFREMGPDAGQVRSPGKASAEVTKSRGQNGSITFLNRSSSTVRLVFVHLKYIAQGYNKYWRSRGWFYIEPGKTLEVWRGRTMNRYFYYAAWSKTGAWEGNHAYWIHKHNRFDTDGVVYPGKEFTKQGMRQVDVGPLVCNYTHVLVD
jgi:uncharacterized membrane protein